jgi:hypothetical protein
VKGKKMTMAAVLIQNAKKAKKEGLPDTKVLQQLEKDPSIELVSDKGLGKECWRCTVCKGKEGQTVVGDIWSSALRL